MYHRIKTLAKVKSGHLTMCTKCSNYHLTFNNIFFEFTQKELNQFKIYVAEIDLEYWEFYYPCPQLKRNIPIPSLQKNLILLFNRQEIEELKKLLFYDSYHCPTTLNSDEIDYQLILN